MRKKFLQLPSIIELEETLATEAARLPVPAKQTVHYASVKPIIAFLNDLGVDTSEIALDKIWPQVREITEKIMNQAIQLILSADRSAISPKAQKLYEYLSEEDQPKKSDLIITFGAKTFARVNKAIELYKQGLALKLLFSGGSPLYDKSKPEAETYQEVAIKAGVPKDDIILETKSITLADNIKSSLNLLDNLQFPYKSIIVVNSPYAQRRGYSHLEKFSPVGTKIYRVNSETRAGLKKDDWFTSEEGIIYVLSEYYKIWFGLVINTN